MFDSRWIDHGLKANLAGRVFQRETGDLMHERSRRLREFLPAAENERRVDLDVNLAGLRRR